jgi:hypothetical protein
MGINHQPNSSRRALLPASGSTMRVLSMRIRYWCFATFLLGTCISAFNPVLKSLSIQPWCEAKIDYSAAKEYIDAHYGNQRTVYFAALQKLEPVFDARKGVYDDKSESWRPATVESAGFTLMQAPTRTTDWKNVSHVRDIYLPELQRILETTFEGSKISHVVFWHPVLRGEKLTQTRPEDASMMPTSNAVAAVHIDTDVGAYEDVESIVSLIEKNRINTGSFPRDELTAALRVGRRFAIVNAWRNIAPVPVARAPLAMLATRYDGPGAFPEAAPDATRSRWYTFPEMKPDELLLFLQYDRDVSRPSDLWHCALPGVGDASAPPRQSFDLRCFIVFEEHVPGSRDRFGLDRRRSLFSHSESQTFCSKQAERRSRA